MRNAMRTFTSPVEKSKKIVKSTCFAAVGSVYCACKYSTYDEQIKMTCIDKINEGNY